MYVYQWYGKHKIDNVAEFNKDFKYIKTIAVSVFRGKELTSWHFGPLRLSLRILYNLIPVKAEIFVECGNVKNYWHDNPLFIFDDTLLHRSVNEYDGRRYCVFMDIIRPSPVPGLIAGTSRHRFGERRAHQFHVLQELEDDRFEQAEEGRDDLSLKSSMLPAVPAAFGRFAYVGLGHLCGRSCIAPCIAGP